MIVPTWLLVVLYSCLNNPSQATTKVIIPAVYREWGDTWSGTPRWVMDAQMRATYGYSVQLYQKLNSSLPNYVATNRGCENGVYYHYIVENYDALPDVMVFTHAHPEEHNANWLDMVRCASPNISYMSLNVRQGYKCRQSWNGLWAKVGIWLEQCMRDTLQTAWGNVSQHELDTRVPPHQPIMMCSYCCQQFIVSRDMIRRRPLHVWKRLQFLLSVQNVCHKGEPNYEHLYAFNASSRLRLGPEDPLLGTNTDTSGSGNHRYSKSLGRVTQAVTSEHLAHVIFGHQALAEPVPTMETYCRNFIPNDRCPSSPCERPLP